MEYKIKTIETEYNGTKFRSRLEARWALFFEWNKIEYYYEKEGYETPYGFYVPDFYLPNVCVHREDEKYKLGVMFEVKPENFELENHKHLGWVCEKLEIAGIYSIGLPVDEWRNEKGLECLVQNSSTEGNDYPMMFLPHCENCNITKITYPESNYLFCPKCKYRYGYDDAYSNMNYRAIKASRFRFHEFIKDLDPRTGYK